MKKILALAMLIALLAAALALPALAQNRFHNDRFENRFGDFFHFNNDRFDNNRFDDNFNNTPAVSQEVGQQSQSGSVNVTSNVSSSGDYAQQCVAPLQFANTGNLQNGQSQLQYRSAAGDLNPQGSSFNFGPSVNTNCNQKVQQSSAASSY